MMEVVNQFLQGSFMDFVVMIVFFFLIYGIVSFCSLIWGVFKKRRDHRNWCKRVKPVGVQIDIQKRGRKYRVQ